MGEVLFFGEVGPASMEGDDERDKRGRREKGGRLKEGSGEEKNAAPMFEF